MSWISALCDTYDSYFAGAPMTDSKPMLRVGFIEKKIYLKVIIDDSGEFYDARVIENDKPVSVPSCPAAEGRTGSSAVPYPLIEDLRYVAGDLSDHSDADFSEYYEAYIENLKKWCCDVDANVPDTLKALLSYLEKKTLISDLVSCRILYEADGRLLNKWTENGVKPPVFKIISKQLPCEKLTVDFSVMTDGGEVILREDNEVGKSWERMLLNFIPGEPQLCYALGSSEPSRYIHPMMDGTAKLVSSKDGNQRFQFRGRFEDEVQAYSLGYTASAKAHNALKWLKSRQGCWRFGYSFIAWNSLCRPAVFPDSHYDDAGEIYPQSEKQYAEKINNAIKGWRNELAEIEHPKVNLMSMEAATKGRISITMFEEFDAAQYFQKIEKWYRSCMWKLLRFHQNKSMYVSVATPDFREIATAVFGDDNMRIVYQDGKAERAITKQVKQLFMDLTGCILYEREISRGYVMKAYHNVMNPMSYTDKDGRWQRTQWDRSMAVTLAMLKYNNNGKDDYSMALDVKRSDRSYLFGRLLAVADVAEYFAMRQERQRDNGAAGRMTNAVRYLTAMQQKPAAVWKGLHDKLIPYLNKLNDNGSYFQYLIGEIIELGDIDEMSSNKPVTEAFLVGYYNQRAELLKGKDNKEDAENE